MDSETQNIIASQFRELPEVIQDTITDSNWQEKIRRVVKNNNLHVDQGAAIENLVFITMLGIETPQRFVQNAKEYAKVSDDQALTISSEVEREIFGDIRRKLIAITETADTIADVDREANSQLNKVAQDIENAVKVNTKPSLKNKIPADYFEKKESPSPSPAPTEIKPDPYKEPIPVVEKKTEITPEVVIEKPTEEEIVIDDVLIEEPQPETEPEPALETTPEPIAKDFEVKMTPAKSADIEVAALKNPIFNPMPKTVDAIKAVEPTLNTTQPAKVDPYRESIE